MNKVKVKITPVRYPGGKSNALKFLDNHFIKDFSEYREPFFGGGSVGLYLMQINKDADYWINDLFYPVYCFWKMLYTNPDQMIEYLLTKKRLHSNHTDARELHTWCRKNIENADEFETACLWYILNKTSYSGMSMIGSYAPLAWDQNFTERCIVNLKNTHDLMRSVKSVRITNLDYNEMLFNSDKNVFIFLDPPYKIPHSLYGKDGQLHREFNHQKFVSDVKQSTNKWLITYNDDPDIKTWFEGYNQLEWSMTYTMKSAVRSDEEKADVKTITPSEKSGKKGKELLIWNYDRNS